MKQAKLTLDQFISQEQMTRMDKVEINRNGVSIIVERGRMDLYEILRSIELDRFMVSWYSGTVLSATIKKATDMLTATVRIAGESMARGNKKLREDFNRFEVSIPDSLMKDDKTVVSVFGISTTGFFNGPTMILDTSDPDYKSFTSNIHVVHHDKETIMGIINKAIEQNYINSMTIRNDSGIIRVEFGLPFIPTHMPTYMHFPNSNSTNNNQEDNANVDSQESVH